MKFFVTNTSQNNTKRIWIEFPTTEVHVLIKGLSIWGCDKVFMNGCSAEFYDDFVICFMTAIKRFGFIKEEFEIT